MPDQNEIDKLNLDRNYFKRGQGMQAQRRIFKNQNYDAFEMEKIAELKNALDSIPVEYNKNSQTDYVLLRFLYANRFDIHYTVQHFIDHLGWLTDPDALDYGEQIKEYDRFIQIIGRDDLMRPVIYIDLSQFKISDDPILLLRNLIIQLVIMEEYMFVPGKIESWIAIFDPNTAAQSAISYESIVYCAKLLQINFPKCLERLYVIDAPAEFRTIYDKLKKDDEGNRVYSDELIAKTIFLQKIDIEKLQFSYFQWADIHKAKPQTKSEEVQTKHVRVFSQLNEDELKPKVHDHSYGDWHDCEHCQKRNLRFQTKTNPEQDQLQMNQSQQQIGDINPNNNNNNNNNTQGNNPNNNYQNNNINNTIQGPLHPLIVYAYGAPEAYNPQIHDPLLTKQAPLPNSVFLDYQQKLPLQSTKYVSQQVQFPPTQHQLSFNQNIQQQSFSQIAPKPNIHVFQPMDGSRTKYDDLIDQFGWNKYGVSQAVSVKELGQTVKSDHPKINIIKNEQTLKKDEYTTPYLQQTYSSTPQKQPSDDIFKNSPNFEQYSDQPRSLKIDIPQQSLKSNPIIDQQSNDYMKYSQNNQISNQYQIPEFNQTNYDTPKQYESYKSDIPTTTYDIKKYDIPTTTYDLPSTKYDINKYEIPAAKYEIPTTKYDIPTTKYDIPTTKYDLPTTKYDINKYDIPTNSKYDTPVYSSPTLNYEIPTKLNNQYEYQAQLPKEYQPNGQQYYQPSSTNNYNFGVLAQRPTDQSISYQQPNQFSTIKNKDDSQYVPNIVEQDGLKYQDETFIVGEGAQKNRRTMENDMQCAIF